jgi:Na+/H+ antiporter NhaD/arsenite permease-like protein
LGNQAFGGQAPTRNSARKRGDGAVEWPDRNARAVPAQAAPLDGSALHWPWALPFLGIVLTIAIAPLLFPRLWLRHYGKLAFIWSALAIVPLAALYDIPTALAAFLHTMLADYMSFIVLLFALYVVAGGILVTGNLRGTPLVNTAILALGTVMASLVGTTGAAMILVRPLLRANAARLHNAHVTVFFSSWPPISAAR